MPAVTPPTLSAIPSFPALTERALGTYNSNAYNCLNTWATTVGPQLVALGANVYANTVSAAADAATATAQAGIATAGAGTATTQAGIATAGAGTATTQAANAAASYDAFDDRYLGSKASNPSADNDGNTLLTGALYWNTTVSEMRAWSGATWSVAYTPTAGMASLNGTETLTEKTLSGTYSINGGAVSGLKEKIINGRMEIDQRAVGVVTPAHGDYLCDRMRATVSAASKFSAGVNATTPAPGFAKHLRFTSLGVYTPGVSEAFGLFQRIEGNNISDLAWGTASALPATVTFMVRSSLTGSAGLQLRNSAADRVYMLPFTINAANTWERKTLLFPGDIGGTWLTDTGIGIQASLIFACSTANQQGTSSAWGSTLIYQPTGGMNLIGTSGATFDLTGLSLKAGDCRNELYNEWRPYADEERLCQRYYYQTNPAGVANNVPSMYGYASSGISFGASFQHPVKMRATPTSTVSGAWTCVGTAASQPTIAYPSITGYFASITTNVLGTAAFVPNATGSVAFSAEL